jgi:outer membrane lipoprotein carrier protein
LVQSLFALAAGLLLAPIATAGPATDRLNDFFKSVTSLRAEFHQTVLDANRKEVQSAEGSFVMQRPNKFRWDYRKPYEQLIVADGAKIWVFDRDLEQVTVRKLDEALGNTPALLLSGTSSLETNFKVVELSPTSDGLSWVELVPLQSDTAFNALRLGFGARHLQGMELVDNFGQTTQLRFTDIKLNPSVRSTEFQFEPPPGVDVVGDDSTRP